jgi:hypothetical protein
LPKNEKPSDVRSMGQPYAGSAASMPSAGKIQFRRKCGAGTQEALLRQQIGGADFGQLFQAEAKPCSGMAGAACRQSVDAPGHDSTFVPDGIHWVV